MRLNRWHRALWLKASAFHCGSTTMACFGRAGSLCAGAGNQRAFTRSFSGYGVRSGDVKRRNCARSISPFSARRFQRFILRQRLRPHVGRKQLRKAIFQAKVGRLLVAEELRAPADENFVDACDCFFRRGIIAGCRLPQFRQSQGAAPQRNGSIRTQDPTFQRPHHAIFIARGESRLPLVHPTCVTFSEHESISSLSAPCFRACDGGNRNVEVRTVRRFRLRWTPWPQPAARQGA